MRRKMFTLALMVLTLIFSVTVLADYERVADNTVPAYHDSALTSRTGNERVDRGDRVIVHQETDRAYEVTYPTSRGSKRRWVPKNIFNSTQKADFQLSSYDLTSLGNNQLRFRGKAWNASNYNEITGIHVYVGGGAGDGGEMIGEFRADGALHRFDSILTVPQNKTGNQLVVIYAVNGVDAKELDRRYINILSNNRRANFQLASYDLTSPGNNQIHLRGRSWNASNMNEITGIHVYIGGGAGDGGTIIKDFRTDQNHNFDVTIDTQNRSGNQLVVIYAVNGIESKELDRRNINILPSGSSSDISNRQQQMANVALSMLGSNKYNNYCQRFVKEVGQKIGLPSGNAGSAFEACDMWRVSTSQNDIPVGATVYFKGRDPSRASYRYGHVGIHVGNGNIVHALSTVRQNPLSYLLQQYEYLGWGWQAGVDLR